MGTQRPSFIMLGFVPSRRLSRFLALWSSAFSSVLLSYHLDMAYSTELLGHLDLFFFSVILLPQVLYYFGTRHWIKYCIFQPPRSYTNTACPGHSWLQGPLKTPQRYLSFAVSGFSGTTLQCKLPFSFLQWLGTSCLISLCFSFSSLDRQCMRIATTHSEIFCSRIEFLSSCNIRLNH